MERITKAEALKILLHGENKGCSIGKMVIQNTPYQANFYYRIYEGKSYELAEIEELDAFMIITNKDYNKISIPSEEAKEWRETLDGLKDALNDVVDILKSIKEGE